MDDWTTMKRTAVAALWLLGSMTAHAQATREFPIAGAGSATCQQWLDRSVGSTDEAMMASWVQGFLSGANSYRYVAYHKDLLLLPEVGDLVARVSIYCIKNPNNLLFNASVRVFKILEESAPRREH